MKNLAIITSAMLLVACGTSKTIGEQYALMYEEKPVSIVVMPPINQTTHAEAKDYFYTTMYVPLCEKGYYVFSPYLTMEMFQQESAYDAEQFLDADLSVIRNVLGADAAMFTIIKSWKRNILLGNLSVDVQYILRSTKTGQTLYSREGDVKVDTNIDAGGGLFGAIAGAVASVVNTAATDKVVAGRACNVFVLSNMPAGKYSPEYGKDAAKPAGKSLLKGTVK